jgi:hypothetical protein
MSATDIELASSTNDVIVSNSTNECLVQDETSTIDETFTLNLPLLDIFAGFIADKDVLLITLKYIFESLFLGSSELTIDKNGILTVVIRYDDIFDALYDELLYVTQGNGPMGLCPYGSNFAYEYQILYSRRSTEHDFDDDHNYTRWQMFEFVQQKISKFIGYNTYVYIDSLSICFKYKTLKAFCTQPEQFVEQFKEHMLNYEGNAWRGTYNPTGKISLEVYNKYIEIMEKY